MALICLDDARHQRVSDDICGIQLDPGNALHRAQNPLGMKKSRWLPLRQIELGRIPGHNDSRAGPHARQKHLHLGRGRVLGFIENDEGVVESPTAHVGQRHHLDDFPVAVAAHLIVIEHLVQGVVEGAQIGIDLLLEISGKETEFLSRFHRRTTEDQLANLSRLESLHRRLDGEIGFPVPAGPNDMTMSCFSNASR